MEKIFKNASIKALRSALASRCELTNLTSCATTYFLRLTAHTTISHPIDEILLPLKWTVHSYGE